MFRIQQLPAGTRRSGLPFACAIIPRMANTNLLQQWQQLQTEYARLQNDFIAFGKYIQNFGQMFGNVSDINVSNVTPISRGRRAHASVTTQRRGRRARAA